MSQSPSAVQSTADREMVLTRLVKAPQPLVFKVWTDPKHVGNWWGPKGFTTTVLEMDVRPGGIWKYIMHGPDGKEYGNLVEYIEVSPTDKLVYSHGAFDDPEFVPFHVTVTFEDQGNQTNIVMRCVFASVEICRNMREFGAEEGGKSTLDCLEEYLAGLNQTV